MPLFPSKRHEYTPDETPLGPRTYPRVGGKPTLLATLARRRWWYIGGALGLVLIVVFIVLMVQRGNQGSITDQVQLTITGPERVSLGSDVSYEINLTNNGRNALNDSKLIVIYPEGYSVTNTDPRADNTQATEFTLGAVQPGEVRTTRLNGRLTGGVKTEKTIIARLLFTPAGSSEPLQIEATFTTIIETAAFTFNASGPTDAVPNSSVEFTLAIASNEAEPLTNVEIHAVYASGFDFQSAEPAPAVNEDTWLFSSLGIGEKQEISITGNLAGTAGEAKRFVFEAGFVDAQGSFIKQAEIEKIVKLAQPAVNLQHTVEGKTELVVGPNDNLEYVISFENGGSTNFANLVLEVGFTPGVWDVQTLAIRNGGTLQSGNLIRWDGVTVPELRALEPGQKGEVVFTVKALGQITVDDAGDKHFATTTTPHIKIGSATVDGNAATIKYRAGISAGATATVVSGPNPPQVGQETTYEVTWTLTNLYNDLSGARFVGQVPGGAEFVAGSGSVSAGEELVYSASNQQLVWNIGRVPANIGKLLPNLTAKFRVTVVPQTNEAGTKKLFATGQAFSAKDTWTNEDRNEPVPDLLTDKIPGP